MLVKTALVPMDDALEYLEKHSNGPLQINELVVSSKCLMACRHCGILARPDGQMMPLELIEALLKSDQIEFPGSNGYILLGGGEPFLYENKGHSKTLADVVLLLLSETKADITIVTAGLTPQNRRIALRALEQMKELGGALERVHIALSFNLFHGIPPERYLECMKETLLRMQRIFSNLNIGLRHDLDNQSQIHELLKRLLGDREIPYNESLVLAVGKGATITGAEIDCECDYLHNLPKFIVHPDGKVSPYCSVGFGAYSGTTLGNVYENDSRQVRDNTKEFLVMHRRRLRETPSGMCICEFHRQAKERFTAPRSTRPIIRIARAA